MLTKNFSSLKLLLVTCCVAGITVTHSTAQPSHDDFMRDAAVCADNYLAYPEPKGVSLTPAPAGYEAFYLSHYGRHGSRWLIGRSAYEKAYDVLREAADSAQLTDKGLALMASIDTLRQWAHGRDGELTPLGARQHRGIAKRMYERFPELFQAGNKIEARSSTVIRCILSMANELAELQGHCPGLDMDMDASSVDMTYINNKEKMDERKSERNDSALTVFRERHFSPVRLLNSLFRSEDYWRAHIERPTRFVIDNIWKLYADMQSLEPDRRVCMKGLFTDEELYNIWLVRNAEWYTSHGPSLSGRSVQMLRQRHLLRNIVEKADSCLALADDSAKSHVTASLRFGHEVVVMPTVCMLNLNGYGARYDNLEQLEQNEWYSYRIFPMASNIQIVFYRKPDADILVKVLLNEREATLPQLTPACGSVYYKWSDLRQYCLDCIQR